MINPVKFDQHTLKLYSQHTYWVWCTWKSSESLDVYYLVCMNLNTTFVIFNPHYLLDQIGSNSSTSAIKFYADNFSKLKFHITDRQCRDSFIV